jgi:hypothetical protein
MLASSKLLQDAITGDLIGQGLEFSGRAGNCQWVMGMVPARSLAINVLADPSYVWEEPAA